MFLVLSCTKNKNSFDENKLKVCVVNFAQYDIAKSILADKADIKLLLKPGAESHSFEPSPQDIKLISSADLFIYTGGENDSWVERILSSLNRKPKVFSLMDAVFSDINEKEMFADFDEHVWTSPKNVIKIAEKLEKEFSSLDKINSDFYFEQKEIYKKELNLLHQDFSNLVKNSKRKVIIFGDRFPLKHFAHEYGLEYYSAFSNCSTDVEVSAQTIKKLIKIVNEKNIPVVFTIELSNGKIADTICEATKTEKREFYTCHNISVEHFEKNENYISLMKKNLESLKFALR